MDNFTAGFPALVLVLNLQGKLAENQKYKMQSWHDSTEQDCQ